MIDLKEISQMMEEGVFISEDVLWEAAERCGEMLKELKERGIVGAAAAMEKKIAKIQNYKPFKRKKGPRSKREIQQSIDYCMGMKKRNEIARLPSEAAKWSYRLDEYEKEFNAALLGQMYQPNIEKSTFAM